MKIKARYDGNHAIQVTAIGKIDHNGKWDIEELFIEVICEAGK